ncbi:diguanylate cyclase domain-containing protein [Pontibacillus sp. HMF3514]|uniref:sensor domain-containing diguanylate cyclase n=1 Tax=Pontibacillus sp. HMF3514 TaxID=2692425 RepID=UPI00131FC20E|nr:diguanylate cyclase [Pontibacillus sp. HMF3514]QHE51970.1 diguanylate cyclase [Pontibacillus sp. HMF3514]
MMEKIESFFGIQKVKTKLLFWFFLLLFLVIVLTIIPYYWLESHDRKSTTMEQLSEQVHLEKEQLENWLEERKQDVKLLSSMTATQMISNQDNSLWIYRDILFGNPAFHSISQTNENGDVALQIHREDRKVVYGFNQEESVKDEKFFKEANEKDIYISSIFEEDHQKFFIISAPIRVKGDFVGVLYGKVKVDVMTSLFNDENGSNYTYIVTKEGSLLDPDKTGTTSIRDTYLFEQALAHKPILKSYENQQKEMYASYSWVNEDRWFIVSERNKSQVFSSLYIQLFVFCMDVLAVYAIGFVLFIGIAQRINHPLHLLAERAREIRHGKWNQHIDFSVFNRSAYEFRELAQSFQSMIVQLQYNMKMMRRTQKQYKNIVDHISEVVYQIDPKGCWVFLNPAWEKVSGYTVREAIGEHFMSFVHREDRVKLYRMLRPLMNKELDHTMHQVRYTQKDGGERIVEFYCTAVFDEQGNLEGYTGAIHDITEWVHAERNLQKANQKLEEMSFKDSLTNIPNRRLFEKYMDQSWTEALKQKNSITFMMVDIDFFKPFNDTYGHLHGDDCLAEIATTLQTEVEKNDGFIARYGGEEFAIIYENLNISEAEEKAEALRNSVKNKKIPHRASEISDYVTISIGMIHRIPDETESITAFVQRADQALYEAKENGKDQVYVQRFSTC